MAQTREQAYSLGRARARLDMYIATSREIESTIQHVTENMMGASPLTRIAKEHVLNTLNGRLGRVTAQINDQRKIVDELKRRQYADVYGMGERKLGELFTADYAKLEARVISWLCSADQLKVGEWYDVVQDGRKIARVKLRDRKHGTGTLLPDHQIAEFEPAAKGPMDWPYAGSVTGRFSASGAEPQELKREPLIRQEIEAHIKLATDDQLREEIKRRNLLPTAAAAQKRAELGHMPVNWLIIELRERGYEVHTKGAMAQALAPQPPEVRQIKRSDLSLYPIDWMKAFLRGQGYVINAPAPWGGYQTISQQLWDLIERHAGRLNELEKEGVRLSPIGLAFKEAYIAEQKRRAT